MKKYTVTFERFEDGVWFAKVRDVEGCHSQGATLEEARERVLEAMGACGLPSNAELEEEILAGAGGPA